VTNLEVELRRAYERRRVRYPSKEGNGAVWVGLETRHPGEGYFWDGLARPVGSRHGREVVIQCTLSGEGRYAAGGREWRVPPGAAFFATVPSAHRYWMPETAAEPWTYFWMIVEHPYVVSRLEKLVERRGAVVELSDEARAAMAAFFKASCAGRYPNDLEQEAAVLDWWLAQERAACRESNSPGARLAAGVEAFALERLARPFSVEELAARWGMSRSQFTHHFRRLTGGSPAARVLAVRLAEVARRLIESDETLARIAQSCGFADANHLGKVFKRERGLTPGEFRRSRRAD
jgi:AraC-like DNA-binding protein